MKKKIDGYRIKKIKIDNISSRYVVSENGDVYSVINNVYRKLKQSTSKDGYKTICLVIDGKYRYCMVHRLVASTFITKPDNKNYVNHIDGNKSNNTVNNLEWVTHQENIDHAWKTGLTGVGEKSSDHKLSNVEVVIICRLLEKTDKRYKEIAKIIGGECTPAMVKTILYGKSWTHISKNYDFSRRQQLLQIRNNNKISEEVVHKICKLLQTKEYTNKEISEMTNATIDQIANIRNRRTWKNIVKLYEF